MPESVLDSIKQAWTDTAPADTKIEVVDTGGVTAPEIAEDTYDAPSDWAHEEREQFRAYQPEVRKWALGKINSVSEGYKTKLTDYEKFQGQYKPFDEFFQQNQAHMQGLQPLDVTKRLFENLRYANQDPKGFVKQFVQSMNLNPQEIFQLQQQAAAADAGGAYQDPDILALRSELAQLKSGIGETQRQLQDRQRAEQAQRDDAWKKEIDEFRNAKGSDGKPKAPYFGEVEGHMAALLKAGQAAKLSDAYDQAIYANPIVRTKVLADAKATERQEADKKAREHAAKAQKAGATVTSNASRSETSSPEPKKGETVVESIRRARADLVKAA